MSQIVYIPRTRNYIFIQIFQVVSTNASNGSDPIWPFPVMAQFTPSRVLGCAHYFPQDQVF